MFIRGVRPLTVPSCLAALRLLPLIDRYAFNDGSYLPLPAGFEVDRLSATALARFALQGPEEFAALLDALRSDPAARWRFDMPYGKRPKDPKGDEMATLEWVPFNMRFKPGSMAGFCMITLSIVRQMLLLPLRGGFTASHTLAGVTLTACDEGGDVSSRVLGSAAGRRDHYRAEAFKRPAAHTLDDRLPRIEAGGRAMEVPKGYTMRISGCKDLCPAGIEPKVAAKLASHSVEEHRRYEKVTKTAKNVHGQPMAIKVPPKADLRADGCLDLLGVRIVRSASIDEFEPLTAANLVANAKVKSLLSPEAWALLVAFQREEQLFAHQYQADKKLYALDKQSDLRKRGRDVEPSPKHCLCPELSSGVPVARVLKAVPSMRVDGLRPVMADMFCPLTMEPRWERMARSLAGAGQLEARPITIQHWVQLQLGAFQVARASMVL